MVEKTLGGKVSVDEWGEIVIDFPRNDVFEDEVRKIPTAHYDFHQRRGWLVWPSEKTIPAILSLAGRYGLTVDPALHLPLEGLVERFRNARYRGSQAHHPISSSTQSTDILGSFYTAGIEYALKTMRCWIAEEYEHMQRIIALDTLIAANAFPAVIVCPANQREGWLELCEECLPEKKLLSKKEPSTDQPFDLAIFTYEALDRASAVIQPLPQRPYGLVVDRAHLLKRADAQRTRSVLAISQGIPYRMLLTPSPMLNGPFELISQLQILDRLTEFGGYDYFFNHFCAGKESGAANGEELGKLLRSSCLLRRPELEPFNFDRQTHFVGFEKRETNQQKELSATGNDDGEGWHSTPRLELARGKLHGAIDWIQTFLESSDEKLVVFAYHREIIEKIASHFHAPWITSETSEAQRTNVIEQFGIKGHFRLVVISIQADILMWSFVAASQAVFVELGSTPRDQKRAENLVGQPAKIHFLIASHTSEENFLDHLEEKRHRIWTILDKLPDQESKPQKTNPRRIFHITAYWNAPDEGH